MNIQAASHRHWAEAYRCALGEMELIVVTSIGPRIMSLRLNGSDNLLYEDSTGFAVKDWRLYGGHRFATAPECDLSYTPDNGRCHAEVAGNRLRISAPIDACGLCKTLEIGAGPAKTSFEIRHILSNAGTKPWTGAAWAITCVPPTGRVVVPLSAQGHTGSTPLRFWEGVKEPYANAEHPQWQASGKRLLVKPTGARGKVGLFSHQGCLAHDQSNLAFVIEASVDGAAARYPDEGCNVEVFTCRDFLELETLGPMRSLLPGEELHHVERWRVLRGEAFGQMGVSEHAIPSAVLQNRPDTSTYGEIRA